MINIFLFTQNVLIKSICKYCNLTCEGDENIFITTHYLFENEKEIIKNCFNNVEFYCFADFLTDAEMAACDIDAYKKATIKYDNYINGIKKIKNKIVANKIEDLYPRAKKYVLASDLGIELNVWKRLGYKWLEGEYYHKETEGISIIINKMIKEIRVFASKNHFLKALYRYFFKNRDKQYDISDVHVAYFENRKYVFLGNMNRIGYRLDVEFINSEEECERLNNGIYENKETCTYMTTWHEHSKCKVPDSDDYDVKWAQDGYLPPNYSHKDYFFKPKNVVYYCWDELGTYLFRNQNLPYELIPFRKKLYLPEPRFPQNIKNVLVVASGSGDWTALKNRSDDDIMVEAFVKMARIYPNISFTYRCHPTWIHPLNVGVNSINRVREYFEYLKLPNLSVSCNIPESSGDEFQYSYSRCSLEEDLKKADLVFGEHSISMIDAAFMQLPFCSINLTKRRNFFVGINELGFPSCSTHDEIAKMINEVTSTEFQIDYLKAIHNYNDMTKK